MKLLIFILSGLFAVSAMASGQGFALRTSENHDEFSKCAVQAALGATEVFTLNRLLYSHVMEGSGPSPLAYLFFSVKTKKGVDLVLRLTFKTKDPSGWYLVQGENGEIYPFAAEVEPKALLVDPKDGSVLGSRDISSCFNYSQNF
ncbi:hypothetical protein AZI86_17365 [Bdellovibrio bacteriovorus]|uniref:Uncharacterized protein n=1 Tax=Bdellovibrio bacteriovorus TaxID=959 RepID=A0A150WFA0_BDEBC|nr:hypothetical protein [Bdellovibrio bacteriovorus]KYG61481.1 hypothetical protein AZI86_17365 [Bdellovibrio bacteriovorus]